MKTQNVRAADIDESPLNPRKRFDEDGLRELSDSIREQGILQTLIVRPQVDDEVRYELVCGARRLRAARLLELEAVPVVVKDLDDRQTMEMMLVENDQRSGVTPLEEADTILKLSTDHKVSIEEIADRIGRSPTLVRRRLKLASLGEPLRALLDAERIGLNSAELLATLSEVLQSELAEGELAAEKTNYQSEPTIWTHYTVTSAVKRALRKLKRAPWPLSEPFAGCVASSECPRRSSAQPALLAEFAEDDDRCLDAARWKTKKTAFIDQKVAEGWRVLDAEEAKQAADRWSRKKSIQPVTHTVRVDGETRSLESLSPDTPRILALTYAGPVACVEIKDVVADLNERGLKDVAYVISGEKERDAKREKRDEDRKKREKRRAQMAAIVETAAPSARQAQPPRRYLA